MQSGTVVAGYVELAMQTAMSRYGLARAELLGAAALDESDVRDPHTRLDAEALWDLLRFVLARTGDAALGLRIAEALDLRQQGFWGYALLSSLTMRQRLEIHLRYQRGRAPAEFSFRVEGDAAIVDVRASQIPEDMVGPFLDWGFGTMCKTHRARLDGRDAELQLWLSYREQSHHSELRAWAGGPVVFDAPCNRVQFPASHLDLQLNGDMHLAKLATAQLDQELDRTVATEQRDVLDAVRQRLESRLPDPSIERVAQDLRMSARTLRRQLTALGASFQELLEQLRRRKAIAYVVESDKPIEPLAEQLGYGDPSSFRRAFRRWTGSSPRAFRVQHRFRKPVPPP